MGCRNWTVGDLKGSVDCVYLCLRVHEPASMCVCVCGGGGGAPAD